MAKGKRRRWTYDRWWKQWNFGPMMVWEHNGRWYILERRRGGCGVLRTPAGNYRRFRSRQSAQRAAERAARGGR